MQTTLGPIVTVDEVCHEVEQALTDWLPAGLAAVADAAGITLEPPTTYRQVPTRDALTSAAFPAAGIFSPGLVGAPDRDEDGNYLATWHVTVVVYLRGDDYLTTQQHGRTYAAVVRTVLAQQMAGITWVGEEYADVDSTAARTLAGVLIDFEIRRSDVLCDLYSAVGTPTDPLTQSTAVTAATADVHPALA